MKRFISVAAWLIVGYIVLITAVKGPISWPDVFQGGLYLGAFGAYIGCMVAGATRG